MNKGQNDSKARKKKKKTTKISKRSPNKDKEKTMSRLKLSPILRREYSPPGELIVKSIVDKVIALSSKISYVNYIEKKIPDFCFDFLREKMLKPVLSQQYLTYNKHPENISTNNQSNKKGQIFYTSQIVKENTWVEIIEPTNMEFDRFDGIFLKFTELPHHSETEHKRRRKSVLSKTKSVENNLGELNLLSEESSKNNNVNFVIKEDVRHRTFRFKTNGNVRKNSEAESKKNEAEKEIISLPPNKNKSKKPQILDLPSYEIPDVLSEFLHYEFDPQNVEFLRKEREELLAKKAKEEKLKALERKTAKKPTDKIKEKLKKKPFDTNKFTFDSNGEILTIKGMKLEGLISDFTNIKNSIKNIKDQTKPQSPGKSAKRSKKVARNSTKVDFNRKSVSRLSLRNLPKEEDATTRKISLANFGRLPPSGSNFNIFLPNIGVVIKENSKVKKGEGEFGKYFNKCSVDDYNKMLNDTIPTQNKSIIQSKMGVSSYRPTFEPSSSMINLKLKSNMSNFSLKKPQNNSTADIHYKETIGNSIMNSVENDSYLDKNNVLNKMNRSNVTTFGGYGALKNNSSFGSGDKYQSLINNSTSGSQSPLLLLKNNISSLKTEIDQLQDLSSTLTVSNVKNPRFKRTNSFLRLNNNDHKLSKKCLNPVNYSLKSQIFSMKPPLKSPLNDFNSKILNDKFWGSNKSSKGGFVLNTQVFSKHATKYQTIQELGKSALSGIKVKLPRNRKFEIKI